MFIEKNYGGYEKIVEFWALRFFSEFLVVVLSNNEPDIVLSLQEERTFCF